MVNQNDSVALKPLNRPKVKSSNAQGNLVEVNLTAATPLNQGYQEPPQQTQKTMDDSRKNFFKIIIDFIILLVVGTPILVFFLVGEPYERGFFCDDESLMHPYHDDTIRMRLLVPVGLCIPILIILIVELIRGKLQLDDDRYLKVLSWNVPICIQNLYKYIGLFLFGMSTCQGTTDIAKYAVGRLRPHFISVCRPIMPDGTDCSNPINLNRYIEKFTCSNSEATAKMLKNMRLSFPSGHSSYSFYTMIFIVLFLQSRMKWKASKLLKHSLQFVLVMFATYTALSRISDYKHHWSDVLAGSVIGISIAFLVVYGITDLFSSKQHLKERLPMTRD